MRKKEFKLPQTPITEQTFVRQGWIRNDVYVVDNDEIDEVDEESEHYFFVLPLPKTRKDEYAPSLASNATDETAALKEAGLKSGQFFVEIMNSEGLGFCTTEEELEILYWALTGENIEE